MRPSLQTTADTLVQGLVEDAWPDFKSKVLSLDVKPHGHRGYSSIQSTLNEAKGYRRLMHELGSRKLKYDQLALIAKKDKSKTPDWGALWQGTTVGALEVKTVYESDDQSKSVYENTRSIREHGLAETRRGYPHISNAIRDKRRSTVDNAKEQLHAYEPKKSILRMVLLIVHFDFEVTWLPDNYAHVASFMDGLTEKGFQVAYQFRGLNAPT